MSLKVSRPGNPVPIDRYPSTLLRRGRHTFDPIDVKLTANQGQLRREVKQLRPWISQIWLWHSSTFQSPTMHKLTCWVFGANPLTLARKRARLPKLVRPNRLDLGSRRCASGTLSPPSPARSRRLSARHSSPTPPAERERERERDSMCVCEKERVCVRERETPSGINHPHLLPGTKPGMGTQ